MRQAVVHSGQSIFDIAIQHCGSVDAAYDVAVLNSLPLDAILMPGQTLLIPKVTDKRVVDEFERRGEVPGTGWVEPPAPPQLPNGCALNTDEHPYWADSSAYGTNNFSFSAHPAGLIDNYGNFLGVTTWAWFWASTEGSTTNQAYVFRLNNLWDNFGYVPVNKWHGCSVRAVKDNVDGIGDGQIIPDAYTDGEGNNYDAVAIGPNLWTTKNLFSDKYQNGDSVPYVSEPGDWSALRTPGRCVYNHDEILETAYGALYNWYAATNGLIGGNGWRLPTLEDWNSIGLYLVGAYPDQISHSTLGQFLKSCRQFNHPLDETPQAL